MQHIIKKQVINLTLSKKTDAFKVQHLVSEQYWREIVPMLQKTFDTISAEGEIIQLDKLEIDLGFIELKDIEKGRWKEDVFKKISEQLYLALTNVSLKQKIKTQAIALSMAEQWFFYMQQGYLHWSTLKTGEQWQQKVLEAFATDAACIQQLRNLIQKNNAALKRIVSQHSEKFLKALMETLTAENQETLPIIISETAEVIQYLEKSATALSKQNKKSLKSTQKNIKQLLWQQVLQFVSRGKNITSSQLAEFLTGENIRGSLQNISKKFFAKKRLTSPAFEKLKKIISEKELIQNKSKKISTTKETETSAPGQLRKIIAKEEYKTKQEIKAIIHNENIPAAPEKIDEEGIFVQHAGTVLLHPFLKRLFQNLELINEENFIDEPAREKALYLLHYLATGNTKPEEHELVIAKILCAWNLQKPVSDAIEFTAHELTEADDLLKEVIQQWEILRGTSVNGLREEFLQRSGKLYTKNESLYLQVESNSIDVLLDYLPWSLNIIMLPWMNTILRVEWR